MKNLVLMSALAVSLAACSQSVFRPAEPGQGSVEDAVSEQVGAPVGDQAQAALRPQARPTTLDTTAVAAPTPSRPAPRPPTNARTVEQFDTTTQEQRVEAAAVPAEPAGERKLGTTVASLGDVSKPGFWLETPLVSSPTKGRVVFPGSGKSAQVDLIPIDGPSTAGSRISLAAMRLIEAPLTDLPTIEVYAGG